jgi:hypothetical protein
MLIAARAFPGFGLLLTRNRQCILEVNRKKLADPIN